MRQRGLIVSMLAEKIPKSAIPLSQRLPQSVNPLIRLGKVTNGHPYEMWEFPAIPAYQTCV